MLSSITKHDVYANIIMMKAADARVIVIVEGSSDIGILEPHLDASTAQCIQGYGKTNSIGAMELVNAYGIEDVVAIVDRDWDDRLDQATIPSVTLTDYYDLDATITFTGSALHRAVSNHTDSTKVSNHLSQISKDLRDLLLDICGPIGVVRFLSAKNGWGLNMDKFPAQEVVTQNKSSVDIDRLVEIAVRRSPACPVGETRLKESLLAELAQIDDMSYFCSGHDIHRSLSYVMSKRWGGQGGERNIARSMRAAFSSDELALTKFYRDVCNWANGRGARVWLSLSPR